MYKKEFDSLPSLPHFVVFWGDNFYLNEYEKKILNQFKDANILKMYYDEFDFDKAKIHLSENSLFGDTNVLILKHNKIPPNIEKLFEVSKDSYFFFFYYGNNHIKYENNVRFFAPDVKELFLFVENKAKELNISISKQAIMKLIQSVEPLFLEKEIEKLSLFKNEIYENDIDEIVFFYKEDRFEDIIVDILEGREFENSLKNILLKVNYNRFLVAIINYIKDLYKYNLYIKKTGLSSLKGLLGYQLPYDVEKKRVSLAIKIKEKDFYKLLKFLLSKELEIRKGKNEEIIFWEVIAYLKIFNSF